MRLKQKRKYFMRKHNLIKLLMLLTLFSYAACSSPEIIDPKKEKEEKKEDNKDNNKPKPEQPAYKNKNTGKYAEALQNLFSRLDPKALTLEDVSIKENEYKEIKEFTDKLMKEKNAKDNEAKIKEILHWVKDNIKYMHNVNEEIAGKYYNINDPYPTFKERLAVCQGYSAIFKVMAHTQGIPAYVINGMLGHAIDSGYGHAWICASVKGVWLILDPTNSKEIKVLNINGKGPGGYTFTPKLIFGTILEDENFEYGIREGYLSVVAIKKTDDMVEIPEYVRGLTIDGFYIGKDIPASVKGIKLSKFIKTIGKEANAMKAYAKNLESVVIDGANNVLETHKNIIYQKNGTEPLYIPSKMKVIRLKASAIIDKNAVEGHDYVEELWFEKGTKEINSFAIDNCKNLKIINIPKGCKYSKDEAFVNCHADLQIKEYE